MTRIFVPPQNDPELQNLRRTADILFSQLKARKRLYDLYFDISLESIEKLQLQYDEAERLCQLKRKELGLPYILNCSLCHNSITDKIYYICMESDVYMENEVYCSQDCANKAYELSENEER